MGKSEHRRLGTAVAIGSLALIPSNVAIGLALILGGAAWAFLNRGEDVPEKERERWAAELGDFSRHLLRLAPLLSMAHKRFGVKESDTSTGWEEVFDGADCPPVRVSAIDELADTKALRFACLLYPADDGRPQAERCSLLSEDEWDQFHRHRLELKHIVQVWGGRLDPDRGYKNTFREFLQKKARHHLKVVRFVLYCELALLLAFPHSPGYKLLPIEESRRLCETLERRVMPTKTRNWLVRWRHK